MRQKGEGKEEEGGEWRQEGRRMGKDERGRGRRDSVSKPSGRGPGGAADNRDEATEVMEMIKEMEVMEVMDVMKAGPACQGADFAAMQTGLFQPNSLSPQMELFSSRRSHTVERSGDVGPSHLGPQPLKSWWDHEVLSVQPQKRRDLHLSLSLLLTSETCRDEALRAPQQQAESPTIMSQHSMPCSRKFHPHSAGSPSLGLFK